MKHGSPWAAALLPLLACAPRGRLMPAARVPPGVAVGPAAPAPPSRVFLSSRFEGLYEVPSPSGPRRFFVGGRRVEGDGEDARVGDAWFSHAVRLAAPGGGGWRFVMAHEVWEAPDFVAPVRLVARAARGRVGRGTGRVVELDGGRVEGIARPLEAFVLDAAFGDEARGVALVEPGVVLHTEDGGARWRVVDLSGDTPSSVVATGDARWVVADASTYRLDADGRAAPVPREALPLPTPLTWGPLSARLSAAVYVPVRAPDVVGPASADGARVFAEHVREGWERRHLVEYDVTADRVLDETDGEEPCRDGRYFAADRPYAVCEDEGHVALLVRDAGAWRERLRVYPCRDEEGASADSRVACAVSADGSRVACAARCAPTDACADGLTVCERTRLGAPAARTVGDAVDRWRLLGYAGDDLVLADRRRQLAHARMTRGQGAPEPLARGSPFADARLAPGSVELGRDGRLRLVAWAADAPGAWGLEGQAGGVLVARSRPAWATAATGFRWCGADGVAVTRAPDGAVWGSTGPDAAWRQLASGAVIGADTDEQPAFDCDALGWRVREGQRVLGWGPPASARYGGVGDAPPSHAPAPPRRAAWACAPDGAEEIPAAAHPDGVSLRGDASYVLTPLGTRLLLQDRVPRRPDASAAFAADYAFPAQARERREGWWQVIDAAPQRATLLWLYQTGDDYRGPLAGQVLEVVPRGLARVRASWRGRAAIGGLFGDGFMAASDGATRAGLATFPPAAQDAHRRALLVVARANRVDATEVVLAPDSGDDVGVYALGVEGGVARVATDGAVLGGPPGALPRVLARGRSARPCGPSARGELVFPTVASWRGGPVDLPFQARYGVEGDALCLRGLHFYWVEVVATPAGLAGWAEGPRGWVRARCEPVPTPG